MVMIFYKNKIQPRQSDSLLLLGLTGAYIQVCRFTGVRVLWEREVLVEVVVRSQLPPH